MAKKRRPYTPEFKAEAVKLVTEQGYSVAEAARSLGIHETLLRSWKQAPEAQGDQAFPRHGKLPPFAEGLRRLRAENRRLRAERDILISASDRDIFVAKYAPGGALLWARRMGSPASGNAWDAALVLKAW